MIPDINKREKKQKKQKGWDSGRNTSTVVVFYSALYCVVIPWPLLSPLDLVNLTSPHLTSPHFTQPHLLLHFSLASSSLLHLYPLLVSLSCCAHTLVSGHPLTGLCSPRRFTHPLPLPRSPIPPPICLLCHAF